MYQNPKADIFMKSNYLPHYVGFYGRDQDGQTINSYTNIEKQSCKNTCDSDNYCNGIIYDNTTKNCWTIKENTKMYSNPKADVFMKPKQLKYYDWSGYICPGSDTIVTNYNNCSNYGERCCKSNLSLSGYCNYFSNPCKRDPKYLVSSDAAPDLATIQNSSGKGWYYENS